MACKGTPTRRHAILLAGLTVGVLCLATACGGAGSAPSATPTTAMASPTPSAASATPTPRVSLASPAISLSSASLGPSRSSAVPSASPVSARPASATQIAEFTAAANGQCGFTSSAFKLTGARVTNNGWGAATVTADNPADQGNGSLIFRIGSGGWTYVTCGSDFTGGSIPQDVVNALFG